MKTLAWSWPMVIVVSTFAAILGIAVPIPGIREVAGLWFLFVCPGVAFARACRLEDPLAEFGLAVGLSLAIDAVVALVLVYAHVWSPAVGLGALALISLAGAALDSVRPAIDTAQEQR